MVSELAWAAAQSASHRKVCLFTAHTAAAANDEDDDDDDDNNNPLYYS